VIQPARARTREKDSAPSSINASKSPHPVYVTATCDNEDLLLSLIIHAHGRKHDCNKGFDAMPHCAQKWGRISHFSWSASKAAARSALQFRALPALLPIRVASLPSLSQQQRERSLLASDD